jgi:hypothetical protein
VYKEIFLFKVMVCFTKAFALSGFNEENLMVMRHRIIFNAGHP